MSDLCARHSDETVISSLIAHADASFSALHMMDAASSYQQALAIKPCNVHALHRMGLVCMHLQKIAEADAYLVRALQADPTRADLWGDAGLVAAMRYDYTRAETFYHHAIGLAEGSAALHSNLADCLRLLGRLAEAKVQYELAVSIELDLHHAVRAIARLSAELGQIDDAVDYWLRAWVLDPSDLDDGLDLIGALAKANRTAELDNVITPIIDQWAASTDALEALCLALYKADRFADMLNAARLGLVTDPHRVKLHHYAAHALSVCGHVSEALVHSTIAVRLAPSDMTMQFQLALLELNDSEYRRGWARHNLFYTMPVARHMQIFPDFRAWNGEPVDGCKFLLVGEQGHGDEIQFVRFADWLHRQGATVDVLVSEAVAVVARSMKSVRSVLTRLPPGPYDYWSHMQRMPEHMKLDLSMLPIAMPYMAAASNEIAYWRAKLEAVAPKENRRIGVVWAGGLHSALDRFRSIDIDALKPIFDLPGTTWFSVQKGERERDGEKLLEQFDLHTLGPSIEDFGDTLAILETLDLLVTVDTSVAHLAGAANLPVWVLVPAYAQWRWLQGRTDSPWYPSMRLFRQRELGDWEPVIEAVRRALDEWRAI